MLDFRHHQTALMITTTIIIVTIIIIMKIIIVTIIIIIIIIPGINVDHELMCAHADRYFVKTPSVWAQKPELLPSKEAEVDTSVAQYTGGIKKVK